MEIRKQAEKAERFRQLHHGPHILVLVNVWDVATARLVEKGGFPAVATSSAAVANSWGYPDGQRISRADMLSVVERIARRVQLPVSADLEAGYGPTDDAAAELAFAMISAGAVGLNFEDGTGDERNPLLPVEQQVERIKRLREVADAIRVPVVINARTDVFLAEVGEPEARFDHAVSRANAYRQAGADSLFVPGVVDGQTIGRLVKAVNGPLNILAGPGVPSVAELERLGVARLSFGSGPFRTVMGWFRKFLREVRDPAALATLTSDAIPYREMNELFEE
ncbi:MAG: isocitrate lyase/phosphoenolpyruvate mutase family protein [Terriglobia bacterium]